MRKWHRWAAIPAGLFLLFIALTGVLLHLDMIRLGASPPGHEPPRKVEVQPLPSNAQLAAMIARLGDVARAESGGSVTQLQIDLAGPRIVLRAGAGGPPGSPQLTIDALTGERIVVPPPPADYHFILQDLHAGYFFGWSGRIVSLLCGLALLVLAASGLQMWWEMRRRGNKGWYW